MIKIELTKDIINLLPQIRIEKTSNGVEIESKKLFHQLGVVESYAIANGEYENHIPGSELTSDAKKWPEEIENRAWEVYYYIVDNLDNILSIVLYYSSNGKGLKPGIYKRFERENGIWKYQKQK
jgi:hypothetical protein